MCSPRSPHIDVIRFTIVVRICFVVSWQFFLWTIFSPDNQAGESSPFGAVQSVSLSGSVVCDSLDSRKPISEFLGFSGTKWLPSWARNGGKVFVCFCKRMPMIKGEGE